VAVGDRHPCTRDRAGQRDSQPGGDLGVAQVDIGVIMREQQREFLAMIILHQFIGDDFARFAHGPDELAAHDDDLIAQGEEIGPTVLRAQAACRDDDDRKKAAQRAEQGRQFLGRHFLFVPAPRDERQQEKAAVVACQNVAEHRLVKPDQFIDGVVDRVCHLDVELDFES